MARNCAHIVHIAEPAYAAVIRTHPTHVGVSRNKFSLYTPGRDVTIIIWQTAKKSSRF